jgi:superfamily II DNA helicase RecQ
VGPSLGHEEEHDRVCARGGSAAAAPFVLDDDDAVFVVVDLLAPLHHHFGHAAFRAGQEDLVRAVLDGRDVLAVMPTGSGKSLGF